MIDIGASLDLLFKIAGQQDATVTIHDVRDLLAEFNAAKAGKLALANLTRAQAITYLQESIRLESLILQLIQTKDDADTNFAEIKSLASSLT